MSYSDSDDEYTQQRRSKFQRKRSEVSKYRRSEKFVNSGEKRTHHSRSRSPSSSVRSDRLKYDKNGYNYYGRYRTYQKSRPNVRPRQLLPMPFKTFILTQNDKISESDALANFVTYKLNFQIDQIESFFKAHHDDEWFRLKYHPEESKIHKEEQAIAVKRRCNVFLELLNAKKIDCVRLDSDNTNDLLKLLDIVVLKLEGGTEEDIAVLEQEYLELETQVTNVDSETKSESADEKLPVQKDKIKKEENTQGKMEKYKTSSIYLSNLPTTTTCNQIELICSKYEGFIRALLSDPNPENNWLRQGWATFKKNSDLKEVCSDIKKFRFKDSELDAVISEGPSNLICLVNGITADEVVVKSDIRISAKIVLHLDKQAGLWLNDEQVVEDKESTEQSRNPVLHNIKDYLVEEEFFEKLDEMNLNRDDNLIGILDKIILYLRIVHSVDYYNHCKYSNEDKMPNRCGILHVRGPPPAWKPKISRFLGKKKEAKLAEFLPVELNESENKLINFGLKDFDKEVDKFVSENTIQLDKDKWQCTLSKKKFSSPDFVRKHIFLKYSDKIEEVTANAEYFNNYLRDPKRMAAILAQPQKPEVMETQSNSRKIIHYGDLDSPDEIEEMY